MSVSEDEDEDEEMEQWIERNLSDPNPCGRATMQFVLLLGLLTGGTVRRGSSEWDSTVGDMQGIINDLEAMPADEWRRWMEESKEIAIMPFRRQMMWLQGVVFH